jgi:tetratricopeptide (TPR) repeat protein
VAEELEESSHGAARSFEAADPGARSMALSGASREEADAFLKRQAQFIDEQTEMLRLQKAMLEEERTLSLSHLRFRHLGELTRFALEIAVGLVILLIVCGLGTMVWSATQDRDLVVDAFSVPQDVAQSGLTGTVLAGRVLDKLGTMEANTFSLAQGTGSNRSDIGDQVRVEIPETGISIGELDRYLRQWLGHETHVSGDLVHTPKGLALTVRYGDAPGATEEGDASDLDGLIEKAAEHIYASARPLRFAEYLGRSNRHAEAEAIIIPLAASGSAEQRALAYISWSDFSFDDGDLYSGLEKADLATRIDPSNAAAWYALSSIASNLAHEEQSVKAGETVIRMLREGRAANLNPDLAAALPILLVADTDQTLADYPGMIATCQRPDVPLKFSDCDSESIAQIEAANHDLAAARRSAALISPKSANGYDMSWEGPLAELFLAAAADDWPNAVLWGKKADAVLKMQRAGLRYQEVTVLWPSLAYAMARNGDMAGAEALIARTARDCDECVRKRGRIAAVQHDWAKAAYWFAMVSARSPSIPDADTDWGQMLLWKGDADGAIAKFESANRKSPHFADPLEMWGEALMLKNRSDLALAKFEEADKIAPNWGRLHLKWGEALTYAGKRGEAWTQFAIAARLDLSGADKQTLTRMQTGQAL